MIKISVYRSENLVTEFESPSGKEISIGRAQGCSIRLEEASVSRLHAVISSQAGQWQLLRKANFGAVLLNGQEVENAPLEGGEEIKIGEFSLRVSIEPTSASQPLTRTNTKGLNVTSSKSYSTNEGGQEDGRTKFVSAGLRAIFRMEPGAANIDEFPMEKDSALFGRGSNCDVVLSEKKASRKHFEVRRQGLSFFLKDLDSANGTLVNGNRVTEIELMAGDLIQVGESRIQISVENKDFFQAQDQFMPVPAHLEQSAPMENAMQFPGDFGGGQEAGVAAPAPEGQEIGPDGTPLPPKPSGTDLIGQFKYNWAKIPKKQRLRYLTILVVFAAVAAMLGNPDEEVKKPAPKVKNANGQIVRRYEDLTPTNQKFVNDNWKDLLSAHERKDFAKMFEYARNILSKVDDYKDTKSYEAIAKRGLDSLEEEKRRHEQEEKQRKIREEVVALQEKGKAIFERALADPKARPELDAIVQDIYAKDPNNSLAAGWKQKIKEKIEEEKHEMEAKAQREELRQKAEDAYTAVENIFKAQKYIQALAEADKLNEVGWSEKEFTDRVASLKEKIRDSLRTVLDPLLMEAKSQRGEGGDLVKARDAYNKVLAVDANNAEARQGLTDIRQILLLRAKRFYSEAILAESISDLQEAKEKYEKCLHTAPDDDNLPPNQDYRRRCQRKLVRFEAFTPEGSSRGN